ncbi:MAG: hypothetical protein H7836_07995 [Magnetococcus sp. YQC-3]
MIERIVQLLNDPRLNEDDFKEILDIVNYRINLKDPRFVESRLYCLNCHRTGLMHNPDNHDLENPFVYCLCGWGKEKFQKERKENNETN